MKVRIFALAKELGIDARELIKHCADAGVTVKSSSALASISVAERDIVVEYVQKQRASEAAQSEPSPMAPVRETTRKLGKVRAIKAMVPRGRAARLHGTAVSVEEAPEPTPEPGPVTEVVEEPEAPEPGDVDTTEPEVVVAEAPVEVEEVPITPSAETETDVEPTEAGTEPAPREVESEPEAARTVPLTRDQYIPSAGTGSSKIRELRQRAAATRDEAGRATTRPKSRAKPAFPYLAQPPKYKMPKVEKKKSEEAPAQKPDLKLTADFLEQQSPLAAHLRKHAEQKRRKKEGPEFEKSEVQPERARGGMGLIEARQQRREKRKQARRLVPDEAETKARRQTARRRRTKSTTQTGLKTSAQIDLPINVRGFCEAVGRASGPVMKILFGMGQMLTINDALDEETALEVAMELGVDLELKRPRDVEDELADLLDQADPEETLVPRPPIITILGHVDHGKTSLLDKIRSSNVVSGEAGGITQHIAAYQVEHNGQKVTFVDTPGHAAFGEMRARGANVTDLIVLVVAADDGVMPQTVECISHAKASGVPITVALNKMDLPDINVEKVLADLAAHEITAQEWGGDVDVVRTSATTGQGIDELLETLLVTAELHEFKASSERPALGVCIESFRDDHRGPLAWLIVQTGTLKIGDVILCGSTFGRVRAMYNDRDEEIQSAGPSTPVVVAGLDDVPGAGHHFFVLPELDQAREAAETRQQRGRTEVLARRQRPRRLEDILDAARRGTAQDVPLIVKADTPGSLEALRGEINKFEHPEVSVTIIHEGVGGVNESDVYLASASGAIIVAFQVIAEDRARALAEKEDVEIRRYNIIYEVTDQIKRTLEGLLEPEQVQVPTGRALVLQTFNISRYGTIAGCRVLNGTIERNNRVHVIRDQKILNDYGIASLRRVKDDVKEVREGMECGIRLEGFNDVKDGDLLEAFRIDVVKRTLD